MMNKNRHCSYSYRILQSLGKNNHYSNNHKDKGTNAAVIRGKEKYTKLSAYNSRIRPDQKSQIK